MMELDKVMTVEGVPNLIKIEEADNKILQDSIIDLQLSKEIFEMSKNEENSNGSVFRVIMEYYYKSVKEHNFIWSNLLVKYVGEDYASYYKDVYKFDTVRKLIFLMKS